MPEGDTIHRVSARMNAALAGREIARAEAPSRRSPVHLHAGELAGRTMERAEAFGKHLVLHFSGALALHSHLGMNGRWFVTASGGGGVGTPWLRLSAGEAVAAQRGGKILRILSEGKLRNDPTLRRLGPDPLRPGFDPEAAAQRLRAMGHGREVGEAVLDQEIIAGIGNAIRNEAFFRARIDPWRKVQDLAPAELAAVVEENTRVMKLSIAQGRRPHSIYRAHRRGCPRCGGRVSVRGQGDDNRATYWCPVCQT
jgi:endonuclease VIII